MSYYEQKLQLNSASQKDRYLEEQQEFMNKEFENSTTIETIKEEDEIGTFSFDDIDVRINHIISNITSGVKDGDDFRVILFKDMQKILTKGLYYIFNDNYWLATFMDSSRSQAKKIVVRRCNNSIKDVDNLGKVIEYPCIVGYDASAFNPFVSGGIITPSNNIMLIVQGNDYTRSLVVNHRIVINGRPFKLVGYNNYMENNMFNKRVDLLILDFMLDTIHVKDDFVNSVAYNGKDIIIEEPITTETKIILPQITEILQGRTIDLNAYLSVNSSMVTNPISCTTTGSPVANYTLTQVDDNNFTLINKLRSSEPLILTFSTIYNGVTITDTLEIILRAVF